jgi:hypothetical protein
MKRRKWLMKLKALFAVMALSLLASTSFAADAVKPADAAAKPADAAAAKPAEAKKEEKVTLKADADAEVKAAIEAADAATTAAKKAGFEWFWKDKPASAHLEDAIKAANEGKKEDAMKLAKVIEASGKAGVEQAEKAKTAAPRL